KIDFPNHTPTAIRRTASQRSGKRIGGTGWGCPSISAISSSWFSRNTAVSAAALGGSQQDGGRRPHRPPPFHLIQFRLLRQGMAPTARATFSRPLPQTVVVPLPATLYHVCC